MWTGKIKKKEKFDGKQQLLLKWPIVTKIDQLFKILHTPA